MFSFRGGVHPLGKKQITRMKPLNKFPVPEKVFIPLSQHIGAPAKMIVKKGDYVKAGTLIAEAQGFVSANIFSSISGTVQGTVLLPNVQGVKIPHIAIENDGLYETEFLDPLTEFNKDAILNRIKEAGIVGMGGATFPAHVKYSPPKPIDVLIINGAECEPYITCDYRLMVEKTSEVINGAKYLQTVLGANRLIFGIERNKSVAISKIREQCGREAEVLSLRVKFPQGAEKQLIYSATKRKVPVGGLPADVGVVVANLQTVHAIYNAVRLGKPLYERAMTISGEGVKNPGNYWVKNGTPYSFLYDYCKAYASEAWTLKVISGGPMMGFAQHSLDAVTTKGTSSVLFLTASELSLNNYTECISCAKCADACPMRLMPMQIDQAMDADDPKEAKRWDVLSCIECGSCAFVCPAKRPLVQSMRLAKKLIREQKL